MRTRPRRRSDMCVSKDQVSGDRFCVDRRFVGELSWTAVQGERWVCCWGLGGGGRGVARLGRRWAPSPTLTVAFR